MADDQSPENTADPIHHNTPDGGVWHSGPAAPLADAVAEEMRLARRWTLEGDDIVAVRGIARIDPPLDETWIVVTYCVRDRWGNEPGEFQAVDLGGRRLAVSAPPEEALAIPAVAPISLDVASLNALAAISAAEAAEPAAESKSKK